MTKYTELFSEWLATEGNALPAVFSQIEGFDDLFVAEYCDKEIGFETPDLFNIKLQARANIVIPEYAQRIENLEIAKTAAKNAKKTRETTFDAGERRSDNYALPTNAAALPQPSESGTSEAYTDTTTENTSGYTPDEAMENVRFYERSVVLLKQECLREFRNLFMEVY